MITDLTDLTHPLSEESAEFADDDEATGWRAMADEVVREREAFEHGLRLTWEHEDDFDPLLGEVAAARDAMLAAEARMRLLIAYDDDEVAAVARLTGAARPPARGSTVNGGTATSSWRHPPRPAAWPASTRTPIQHGRSRAAKQAIQPHLPLPRRDPNRCFLAG